jgi:hypothetical protein
MLFLSKLDLELFVALLQMFDFVLEEDLVSCYFGLEFIVLCLELKVFVLVLVGLLLGLGELLGG